jgi:tetratricopeptide (TPR) repeat protein
MFTDIQGSTRKWQLHPDSMSEALARHDMIVRREVELSGGRVVKHTGDGFMIAFTCGTALECAVGIQIALLKQDWSSVDGLDVRIGVHTGEAVECGDDYFGDAVNRTMRLMSAAWGGQIVTSASAAEFESIPDGALLSDAGMHMLKDLLEPERIFILEHPKLRKGFPPLQTVSSRPHNLPVQPTPFLGREREIREMLALLSEHDRRLVTILGQGGSGKTRLAVQTAAEIFASFPDGVWFVPLDSVSTAAGIIAAIAQSLSIPFSGSRDEEARLFTAMAGMKSLLVLDNFEHIADHSPLVSRMLSACPDVRVIVTSRRCLGIRGESIFDLSGMSLPESPDDELERFDSTRLFLETARRAKPFFTPGQADRRAIRDICGFLQGLPLAIELAAPWIRIIPCDELLHEIQRDPRLLSSVSGDLPQRQRSLHAVFEYSWGLLTESERIALASVSVFEGGFSSQAAAEVASCGIATLQSLFENSLLKSRPGGGYILHPLTRQFAADRLSGNPELKDTVERAHSLHYAKFLDECYKTVHSEGQAEALNRISFELPNLLRGAEHAYGHLESRTMETYAKTVSVLFQLRSRFGEAIEFFENLSLILEEAVAGNRCDERFVTKTRAELRERMGTFHLLTGNHTAAAPFLRAAAELSSSIGDPALEVLCLAGLGNSAHLQGQFDSAMELWSKALSISRNCGLEQSVSSLLCNIASVRKRRGELAQARSLLEEAVANVKGSGNAFMRASVLSNIAEIMLTEGDVIGAEENHRQSLALRRETGDLRGISFTLEKLSRIAESRSPAEALELARESLRCAGKDGGNRRVYAQIQLARALALVGEMKEASETLGDAESHAERLDLPSLASQCREARTFIQEASGAGNGP